MITRVISSHTRVLYLLGAFWS